MISILRSATDTRAVVQPEPSSFGLLLRYFQALLTPDSLHSLVIHPPTLLPKQRRDPAIAVPTEAASQLDGPLDQTGFIIGTSDRSEGVRSGSQGVNGFVFTFLVSGNDLIIGGDFTEADGITVNGIARWDGRTGVPPSIFSGR